ncbi:MAG: hypothetical protein MUF14_04325 [Hyphomonadaceae bacterium]|jgi:hypothetical protein|nr:hypothetical protein [Hyphomonadaceae bacterium]
MNASEDPHAESLRILDLAGDPPPVPLARIEAAALAGFEEAFPKQAKAGWVVWASGIAAAVVLAIAVPLVLDAVPAGPVAVEQPATAEQLDDADAFAAAMLGYSEAEASDVNAAVEDVLEAL